MIGWLFDALLALALPILAWQTLATRDLLKAVILFIAFGLLVSLSWVRLGAPDIALAEAAIGAGITGALLLNTLGSLYSGENSDRRVAAEDPVKKPTDHQNRRTYVRLLVALPTLALGLALAWAVASMPEPGSRLPTLVDENLSESGATNPVTAVLLNFRSYDTLLEVGVLLLAALGVWSLGVGPRRLGEKNGRLGEAPLLKALARLLAPVMVLVAAYLLYAGTKAPGGAFQAAAVLGALGILLLLADLVRAPLSREKALRFGLAFGFGVFLLIACVTLALGRLLEYPPGWAYALILLVEAVLTASIALTLVVLFVAVPPRSANGAAERGRDKAR